MRVDERNIAAGQTASLWIALSRSPERLARMEGRATKAWGELPMPARRAWTDENASILPLIRW
jgi:hypothetical protein